MSAKPPQYRIWIGRDETTGAIYGVTAAATRSECRVRIIAEYSIPKTLKPVRFKLVPARAGDTFRKVRR